MYYQIALVNTKHWSLIYCVLFILGKINLSQLLVDLSPHILYGIILKEYDCLNKYHIRFMVYCVGKSNVCVGSTSRYSFLFFKHPMDVIHRRIHLLETATHQPRHRMRSTQMLCG